MSVKITPKIDCPAECQEYIVDLDDSSFFIYNNELWMTQGDYGYCVSNPSASYVFDADIEGRIYPVDVEIKWSYPTTKKDKK